MISIGVNLPQKTQEIVQYSKNGCRLLSQTPKGKTRTTLVETDFGKGLKEIVQTFSYDGKIQDLTITHYDHNGIELGCLVRSHLPKEGYTEIKTSVYGENDHLISSCTERQKLLTEKDGSKSLLRIKLKKHLGEGERYEEQSYEHLHNSANKDSNKTLYTTATRVDDGQVINKTVNGNIQNLEEIAKDPYLHIRNYPDKEFTQSASYIAAEKQGVNRGYFTDKSLKEGVGYFSRWENRVVMDSSQFQKWEMIETLNHEYRHKFQHTQINKLFKKFFNIFRTDKNKIYMTPSESKQAKNFLKANFNYKNPRIDFEGYYNNLLEVDANKAGLKAKREYDDFTLKLAKTFNADYFMRMFGINLYNMP